MTFPHHYKHSYYFSDPKSCDELFKRGLDVSGEFNIDPDGYEKGSDPFKVYCDVEKGKTEN